jgi:hypothetical protein
MSDQPTDGINYAEANPPGFCPTEPTGIEYALGEIETAIDRGDPFDDDDEPAEMSPGTLALYELLGRFRQLVRTARSQDATEPAEVTHIRQIGVTLANLCGHRAGPAAQPGDATCQWCNAVYESTKAPAADPDDYWVQLAADLHQVADRIATLAGTDSGPHASANLYLRASLFDSDADRAIPIINAIADALGVSTETKTEGRGTSRRTKRRMKLSANKLDVVAYADVPNPPTAAEKRATLAAQNEALRARVAELEAQTAGGAR